jgi:hypothetical protein
MPTVKNYNKKSHKTDALLKLLTKGSSQSNPLLDEKFKDDVILSINGKKPPKAVYHAGEEIDRDIITELASEFLPVAILRFNICSCDRCFAEMLTNISEKSPRAIVKVRSHDDFLRAEYLKKQHRNAVLDAVVGEVIRFRHRRKHKTVDKGVVPETRMQNTELTA